MKHSSEKARYPFTYGDENTNEVMLSDSIVKLMKSERFQSHMKSVFFAWLTILCYTLLR